jgi:hypothetical protein
MLVVVSALIPLSAVLLPTNVAMPAVLGSVVVVVTGVRAIFHWQENYLRFSGAREAVEVERRMYFTGASPYDDAATRDQVLVANVSRIEHDEMGRWTRLAEKRAVQ